MEIFWLGHSCFRLRGRDATVVTDPCPPSTGYRIGKLTADVVTISQNVPERSYLQGFSGEPKVLNGPGEYEVSGVLITGVRTDHERKEGPRNTAYVLDIDDLRVCHLGAMSRVPTGDDVEVLSGVDVLLIPVGGGQTLGAAAAAEAVSLLEPRIIIPMHYKTEVSTGDLEQVDRFLREVSAQAKTPEPRLNVTRSSVPQDPTVVLLEYRR